MQIPFFKVDCSGNEKKYIQEVLESGWLTTSEKCLEFEKRFAVKIGVKYACAVNSATAALHLAVEALGVKHGDRVFVPTMTFTASAEVIRYLGAEPHFLDVEYGTNLVTPAILEEAARRHPGTKALLLVHYGGQACDMEGILDVCRRHGLKVIEDAAHAFPTRYKEKMIGSFGDVTCFSFYANKTITTGEGGMLLTNEEAVFNRVKVMRLHGINRDIWDRFTAQKADWEYDIVAPGFKYNLSDVAAAIGLAQLERAEEFRNGRERCARYYFNELNDMACLDLPLIHCTMSDHSWHLFPLILKTDAMVERNRFIRLMSERGIGLSVHYKPLHRMTYYKERYQLRPQDFPNAERVWQGNFSLPIYPSLTCNELGYICQSIREILA
jgi:dTDP-4-amino-4,6-dideoxygalactose transaminase